jgi:predicted DNA-binding WGR domain protein
VETETIFATFMLKLHKLIDGKLHYWEIWDTQEKSAIIHWGKVGEPGESQELKSGFLSDYKKTVQKEISRKRNEGYEEIADDDHAFLEIEYMVDGFGTEEDLDKRHRLEEMMDDFLGWSGLGYCDGGSIGSGTMEVGCVVVDFEIAKKAIEDHLKGTEYADYSRIFQLDTD